MFFRFAMPRAGTSLVLASLTAVSLASVALAGSVPLKTIAERHVLSALGRNWPASRLKGFVNARTRVPFDNVQAKCRRQPAKTAWPARFSCVVRPHDRQSRIRLYLKYIGLRDGSFHVHWVDLRRVPAS